MSSDKNGMRERVIVSGDEASGRDSHGSSLLPMLVAGLVLITISAAVLMAFV